METGELIIKKRRGRPKGAKTSRTKVLCRKYAEILLAGKHRRGRPAHNLKKQIVAKRIMANREIAKESGMKRFLMGKPPKKLSRHQKTARTKKIQEYKRRKFSCQTFSPESLATAA